MRMKHSLHLAMLSLAISCTPYVAPAPHTEVHLPANRPEPIPTETPQPQKESNLTFIDTLNKGKEVVLSENDFTLPTVAKTGNVPSTTVQSESVMHFRIQVIASSQSDKLKEDKKKLEKQLNIPLTIIYEAPHYKLYAGDFSQRTEAETFLLKIKKLGYKDAWVVLTKNKFKQ